jgi:hypothetical protein
MNSKLIKALPLLLLFGVVGCQQQGPAERTGERIDDAGQRTGERIEDAGEDIQRRMD